MLRPRHLNLAHRILLSFMAGQPKKAEIKKWCWNVSCSLFPVICNFVYDEQSWLLVAFAKGTASSDKVQNKEALCDLQRPTWRHNDLPSCASAFQGIDISPNHWLFSGLQYLRLNSYQMIGTEETLQPKNRRSTIQLLRQNIQWHQLVTCVFSLEHSEAGTPPIEYVVQKQVRSKLTVQYLETLKNGNAQGSHEVPHFFRANPVAFTLLWPLLQRQA